MAQPRQRRPDRQGEVTAPTRTQVLIQQFTQSLRNLTRLVTTPNVLEDPQKLERIQNMLRDMGETISQLRTGASARKATPARVESHVYRVSIGERQYRVTLPEQLPPRTARARLHEMLLHNELVGPGGRPLRAQVEMIAPTGTSQRAQEARREAERFNSPRTPATARLDRFRDAYLERTYIDGQYVSDGTVRIASR
ncbi:MAG: hypothetical protein ABH983_03950 [Candidatus Micrarchaeota archaeon]|nr:hypothetical protein [Candidatus Micrarchaeota archaeon]MBU1681541.1 hypothetical protein [Candidatus Micrarchaeota archaeon]